MSIRCMKALTLLAAAKDVKQLLRSLQHFGCVEVTQVEEEGFTPVFSGASRLRLFAREVQQAMDTLRQYAPQKKPLLAPKRPVAENEFWEKTYWRKDLRTARDINGYAQTVEALSAKEAQFTAQRMSLDPWREYSLPLELEGTGKTRLLLGTLPGKVDLAAAKQALGEAAELSEFFLLSDTKELKYIAVLVHESQEAAALEALHSSGFTRPVWKELTGTVEENQAAFDKEIGIIRAQRAMEKQKIAALGGERENLETLLDRLNQYLAREETADKLRKRGAVVLLRGWLPTDKEEEFRALMDEIGCAWELREPTEEEYPDVPVSLKNNALTSPLNMVTEMYSLPAYHSLDPNPLMAPFFILFYGIMMADMGYGLVMFLLGVVIAKKKRPEGTLKHMSGLLILCGISTFIWGAITGGFFGDFIPQLLRLINPASTFELPALFTPLGDTMMILVGAMALGMVQIVTGMLISVIEKCKKRQYLDAFFNEITWWVVFVGIALMALGVTNLVLYAGLALVVLGPLVMNKGVGGKLAGVFASLYNNVTGFAGDILSYSRLMALMLAGSVIAQVFNTIGAIAGNVVVYVIISLVGNTLNFGLNLLGCYVHDLRLQCLEYFNKFYQDGGRPFKPLAIKTEFVDIQSEN